MRAHRQGTAECKELKYPTLACAFLAFFAGVFSDAASASLSDFLFSGAFTSVDRSFFSSDAALSSLPFSSANFGGYPLWCGSKEEGLGFGLSQFRGQGSKRVFRAYAITPIRGSWA